MSIVGGATVPGAGPDEPRVAGLLAVDHERVPVPLARVARLDRARRGAIATSARGGGVRRAEPGSCGPLVLEARPAAGGIALEVWGPPATPAAEAERALLAARAWVGLDDDAPPDFADLVGDDPVLRHLHRHTGTPRLARLPRIGEAIGRAVLAQLVQSLEADRSTAQVAVLAGAQAPGGLWCWPSPPTLGGVPAWELRRCGVSLRGARALHAASVADSRLREAGRDWTLLDRRLRALPGVGVWTSGETRGALGDPDAVPVGDYNLPTVVGSVLAGEPTDDAGMLALLAPYAGQRGRVLRLIVSGMAAGLTRRPRRRAPRAALSAHRYA